MSEDEIAKSNSNRWRIWVPIALFLLGVIWLASGQSITVARLWLAEFGNAGPIGFIVIGTGLMSLFVPKTIVSIAAGGIFGMPDGFWILSLTAVVSAMINYQIGKWSLQGITRSINDGDTKIRRSLGRLASTAESGGVGFHLMVRLLPIPTTVISYSMGASDARQRPYLLAALLASVPQWLWVYCGAMATDPTQTNAKWIGVLVSAGAAIAFSYWLSRHAQKMSEARKVSDATLD